MTNKEALALFSYIPYSLMLLGMIEGARRWKNLGVGQKRLIVLIFMAALAEGVSEVLWRQEANNFPVFHIYALCEFSILALIYRTTFQQPVIRKILKLSVLFFIAFGVANALFFQSILEPNTNVITTSSALLCTLSIWFLFRVLNDMRYERLEKSAMFWINIGVLTYFSSSFVLFNFGEQLVSTSIESSINIWTLHIFFNVIHYIAFCIALWMKPE